MVVELINVGTELLLGNIVNTNGAYLAQQFAGLGLSMYYQTSVGDNEERLKEVIETAMKRSDLVVLSGGLGPTRDDLTKETTAKAIGRSLVEDAHTRERIQQYFEKTKKKASDNNWKQAQIIEGAKVLDNDNGTAPGLIIEGDAATVILLPGPPNELIPMFEAKVIPYLQSLQSDVIYSTMVKVVGIGESMAETMIQDLIDGQTNPTIAPYAKTAQVHFRVTAKAESLKEAKELVKPVVKELKHRFKEHVYSTNEAEELEDVIVYLLNKYKLVLTTAESCTGGMLAARMVNVSGVSEVFKEGFVTYSNKAKRKHLDVSKSTLKKYGAVSEETAKEMAKGAAIGTDSDVAISITGLAGPNGDEGKPVGTVYIGCFANGKVKVEKYNFQGNRKKIREQSVIYGMDLLRRCIIEQYTK